MVLHALVALLFMVPCSPAKALSARPRAVPREAINVGSDGSDGVFVAQGNVEIDLATQGTYDSVNWRVVFNYESALLIRHGDSFLKLKAIEGDLSAIRAGHILANEPTP